MKKLILILLPCVFLFTGCDLFFDILLGSDGGSNNYVQETVTVDEDGDVYLVQVNNTQKNQDSAYVTSTESNREISEENKINTNELNTYFYNDTTVIDRLNNSIKINESSRYVFSTVTSTLKNNNYNDGTKKDFLILERDKYGNETFVSREAVLYTSNDKCNTWYVSKDLKNSDLNSDFNTQAKNQCNNLASNFSKLIEEEEKYFGSHKYGEHSSLYIDPQEKIDIIVCDIYNDATSTQTGGTFGYFASGDYYPKTLYSTSNESQCIYIDSNFLIKSANQCYSTLLHEYAHLLEHTTKYVKNNLNQQNNPKETWYSEMIAMLAEDLLHEVIDLNVSYTSISRIPLFLKYTNYGFTNWLSGKNNEVLISYANCYVYGSYLVRNFGGVDLIKEIVSNNYVGMESINMALKKYNSSNIDFNYTVEHFWEIMFPEYTDLYSLNKLCTSNNSKVKFIALDIKSSLNNSEKKAIYNSSLTKTIYPQGFYIQYIGQNLQSYTVSYNDNLLNYSFVNTK